jgi:hypothetical protein
MLAVSTNFELMNSVRSRGLSIQIPNIAELRDTNVLKVVMGIIREKLAGNEGLLSLVEFIIQDFYQGELPKKLVPAWDGSTSHTYQLSPRGLLDYLKMLIEDPKRVEIIKGRKTAYAQYLTDQARQKEEARAARDADPFRGDEELRQATERADREDAKKQHYVGDGSGGLSDASGELEKFGFEILDPKRKGLTVVTEVTDKRSDEELIDVPLGDEEPADPGKK